MISLRKIRLLLCAVVMMFIGTSYASSFNVSSYTTQSKLSKGKWVKISIPESGIYEITYDELREMGFNDPSSVRLYGRGGYRISEVMTGKPTDDLLPVAVVRANDKICFYGNGPVRYSLANYTTTPHFTREFNPYSQVGCYFLTDEGGTEKQVSYKTQVNVTNYVDKTSSLGFIHHEKEMSSISNSGKDLLGENFVNGSLKIDFDLPRIADSTIVVHTTIAAYPNSVAYAKAVVHSDGASDTTAYTASSSRIYAPTVHVLYNYASPYGQLKLSHPSEHCQFEPMVTCESTVDFSRLDYFIVTYTHDNVLNEEDGNQMIMAYAKPKGNERYMLPGASSSTMVWLINDPYSPLMMHLDPYSDGSGSGYSFFTSASSYSIYVAFDPAKTLKKISKFEDVPNQNLHGMETPELLILTDKLFYEQAERIADLHRAIDGIDVLVVDQDQVFNEFSSGTRDVMGYRLFCKMLYDRNPEKFKNLLLMGPGSFDNREILGEHVGHLLTYQSDNSNYDDYSYTTDDFFGFLAENSGSNISAERLSIGVGRIPSNNLAEAKSDVDKLVEYYSNPDYGVWRNNTLVFSDSPDEGEFMYEGEGYKNQIDNALLTGMHVNTVHNSMYPRSTEQPNVVFERKTASVAKKKLSNIFKSGVYFGTYVGHAGSIGFTKYNNMWNSVDVLNTSMNHLPILSTSCCDVAHYDGDRRGVAEVMFHKRDGGAIALLTTSRMVFGYNNDKMNTNFINAFFSNATQGKMVTLGEAYRNSKLAFTSAETNKLSFFILGDPAIKINYPVSRFNITKINSADMTDTNTVAQISPLMKFDIEAQVLDDNGNLDAGFNGDATVTLYDKQDLFVTMDDYVNGIKVDRDIFTDREKLAEVDGRVVNGVFRGQMIAPKVPEASDESVLLRVYAHQDNSDIMVNGFTKQITMLPFDEENAIDDDTAPVINSMFINDETTFVNGAYVAPDAMLYICANDDQGISMQSNSIDKDMTLLLDGGKVSYGEIGGFATPADGGKSVNIVFPLVNLTEGQHTLTFTVYDLLGNSATRTITFIVGQVSSVNLVADKLPAYVNDVVNFDLNSDNGSNTNYVVRVTDATGKLMWMTNTSSFPVTWDFKDMEGNTVPAGLYRYFGTYSNGTNYGGTPINKLIVLDPVKTAAR